MIKFPDKIFPDIKYYGIPDKIIDAIRVLYTDTSSAVLVDNNLTDSFPVNTGVLQGDTLAPFLFIMNVDWVMRNSDPEQYGVITKPRQSRRFPERKFNDLDLADDIGLLENSLIKAQEQVTKLSDTAKEIGLQINTGKTEVITVNIPKDQNI